MTKKPPNRIGKSGTRSRVMAKHVKKTATPNHSPIKQNKSIHAMSHVNCEKLAVNAPKQEEQIKLVLYVLHS